MTDTDHRPARARSRPRDGRNWYRISNSAGDGPARIYLYDEIGFFGVTAQDFLRDLNAITGPVEVRVSSPGGDVFESYAIYNALAARTGVTTIVDSLAASAASVVVMAGEERLMARTSQMMIHDAWAISDGNADDLRHMAGRLDAVSGQIAQVYADAAGNSPDMWRDAMRAETWYTPEDALAAGLITGIVGSAREPAAAPEPVPAGASAMAGAGIRASAGPDGPAGDGAYGIPQSRPGDSPQDAGARHEPLTGTHSHPHPAYGSQGGDQTHTHEHIHDGDASHAHSHADPGEAPGDQTDAGSGQPEDSAEPGPRADGTDTGAWDGNAAMTEASGAEDPAAAFAAICAGEHTDGEPGQRGHWALPHHVHQGAPPNEAGVRNSLSRLPQTQDLKNRQAAQNHLEAHMKDINPDWEPSDAHRPGDGSGDRGEAQGTAPSPAPASRTRPNPHPGNGHHQEEGTTVTTMSIEDRVARRDEIEARLTELDAEHGDSHLPQPVQAEFDSLSAELDEHQAEIGRHEQARETRRARVAAIAARQRGERADGGDAGYQDPAEGGTAAPPTSQAGTSVPRNGIANMSRSTGPALTRGRTDMSVYDMDDLRKRSRSAEDMTALCKDNALRAVERATFPGSETREQAQTTVERMLARVPDENGTLAKRILATGNPVYMKAWGRAVARLSTSVLTQDEIRALSVGVGSDGGFAVPFELDPTVLLVSDGAISPIRQLSRVVQITGKEYDLVTSHGITVTRSGEGTPVPDNTPQLAQPTIKAERITGFIPFSVEIEQDWQAMQSEMMALLSDAKDVEECQAFTNGTGVAPDASGIVSTLADTSLVTGTGGAAVLAAEDLDALEDAAAPRFRPRAVWMASKTTYNAYRRLLAQQASSAGDDWARPSAGQPAMLRGYAAYENSEMGTTHGTGDKVIIFGDFGRGALVVDRLGMNVELVPHLVDQATARPTGERGLLAIWRNNFMPLIPGAFRALVVG